jgi:hypothetical protein
MTEKNSDNLAADLLWGGKEISDFLGVPPRKAYWMLEQKLIPARKIGDKWVASRRALREHLAPADRVMGAA